MNINIKKIIQNYLLISLDNVNLNKFKCLKELLNKTLFVNNRLNYDIYYEKYCISGNLKLQEKFGYVYFKEWNDNNLNFWSII